MKHSISTILVVILVNLLHMNLASAAKINATSIQSLIDQQLIKNAERYGVVGQSVLVLKNHQMIYQGQQGYANTELDVKLTEKHLFPSYSVTKLFTSVLMMQQVEKGNIALKNSIRSYLPYLPQKWQAVTVEHLLNHTSGIPRYFDIAMKEHRFLPNKKAVFLSLNEQPKHFELGSTNKYNNTNYLLLSAILEKKTGKSYQVLIADNIITPLSLKNTGHASAKKIIKNIVTSYQGNNGIIKRNIDIDWPEYTFAHSGLYSTAKDLATFMTALFSGKLVNQSTLKTLWQPMKLDDGTKGRYAFGFEYSFEDSYIQVGHDGGNRVKIRYYFNPNNPIDNYTIAYLTNGNAYSVWTDVLAESVMSIVDPTTFKMAALKEQFITAILSQNSNTISQAYAAIENAFQGDKAQIERFILYRSYALKYGSGVKSSIPAFKFLVSKFPESKSAQQALIEAIATL